ncbi:MAG TPA: hypothetical protein VFE62_16585 [Gemmataceae bacterium]|nr:hypothetical protein [Gemmataceae bacterium]
MNKPMLLAVLGIAAFLPIQADACSIPVFRYALERWDLTRYEILVYHRGKLPADLAKTLAAWDNAPNKANIDISLLDLDGDIKPDLLKIWQDQEGDPKTPWMVVRNKEASTKFAWAGPCNVANFNSVLDSPIRRAILAHLTRGASGVYVFMTGEDAEQDRAAFAMVKETLQVIEKKITLPEQTKEGPQMILPLPLRVSLPLLVLDRTKPDEALFVKLLFGTEEGLDKVKGPILFPIFGRGRVMCSLSGDELLDKNILITAKFLCGACSCELKAANPGVDMLMSANWNEIFDCLFEDKQCMVMPAETFAALPGDAFKAAPSIAPAPKCCEPETPSATEEIECHECRVCQFDCPIARNWQWILSGVAGAMLTGAGIWTFCLLRK